jgi:GTPase SAR1 family protein
MPYFIVVLGTAGSGKSTLTGALQTYLAENQMDTVTINLDPAVLTLPYKPDIDVRDRVNARELMLEHGLGPNGALVAAVDMLSLQAEELRDEIWSLKSNYMIIDTPGQMEIFAFRETGPITLNIILEGAKSVSLFLIDAVFASSPANYFSALLLATSTFLRLNLPQIIVLHKTDLLTDDDINRILSYKDDPYILAEDLSSSKDSLELPWTSDEIVSMAEKLQSFEMVPVSSRKMEGLDSLYAAIQRVVAGGEDFLTEEPSPRL